MLYMGDGTPRDRKNLNIPAVTGRRTVALIRSFANGQAIVMLSSR